MEINGFRVRIFPVKGGVEIKYNGKRYGTPAQFYDEFRRGMQIDGYDIAVSVKEWGVGKFFECQRVREGIEKKLNEMKWN